MAWWHKVLYGVDPDEEQRRQEILDEQLRIENEKDYAPGGTIYNRTVEERGVEAADRQWAEVQARMEAARVGNVRDEVDEAFWEGLQEGYENTTGAIRGTLAAPFQFTFAALPWQVWVAGLVLLFLYMGGGRWLKGILR